MRPDSSCARQLNILRECLELVRFNNELDQCGPRLRELEHELERAINAPPIACVPATTMELVSEIIVRKLEM
jgi:hypothetical protein